VGGDGWGRGRPEVNFENRSDHHGVTLILVGKRVLSVTQVVLSPFGRFHFFDLGDSNPRPPDQQPWVRTQVPATRALQDTLTKSAFSTRPQEYPNREDAGKRALRLQRAKRPEHSKVLGGPRSEGAARSKGLLVPNGLPGPTGCRGRRAAGPTGCRADGLPGPTGCQCRRAAGAEGLPGPTGCRGRRAAGADGLPGPRGCQCRRAAGADGLPGPTGCRGRRAASADGLPGPRGCRGRRAARAKGLPGPTGCRGRRAAGADGLPPPRGSWGQEAARAKGGLCSTEPLADKTAPRHTARRPQQETTHPIEKFDGHRDPSKDTTPMRIDILKRYLYTSLHFNLILKSLSMNPSL
jgi:hypothetical protein